MSDKRQIASWLMDMDGVLVREEQPIPGAAEFLARLRERGTPFLVLTNNSIYTPRDLSARLKTSGLEVPEEAIWTSALATARFLESQRPGGSAYVIGEAGLTTALHGIGYTLTEREPDYVVLGETRTYSFERITRAIRLVEDFAEDEARRLYERYAIPASGRILWDSVLANLLPGPQDVHVDYHNDDRAPLLFVSGTDDHIMPPKIQQSNLKHYKSDTITEIKEFEGPHLLPAVPGWEAIADEVLDWAVEHAR